MAAIDKMRTLAPPHLSQQPIPDAGVQSLHTLHPDVISRQATINIGTIGHVAHGKTTLVKQITSINTVKFHAEIERNITIKLGYANAKIFQCDACSKSKGVGAYFNAPSGSADNTKCKACGAPGSLVRHISFVDCPGHDFYMATMLTGAAVMDAAILLIAADQPCPQSQTQEHLLAIEMAGVCRSGGVIIVQNKIDLISEVEAQDHYTNINRFLSGTTAAGSPVIPVSAVSGYNVDLVLYYIVNHLKVPTRNLSLKPKFTVIRSFDVNRPGIGIDEIVGGVAGGTLLHGLLQLNDIIEVRPGLVKIDEKTGFCSCYPILTRVVSLFAENNELRYAIPGGLIAIGTLVDPSITRQDRLVGSVIGHPGHLPDVRLNVSISFELLHSLLGVALTVTEQKISVIEPGEVLLFTVGSNSVAGTVKAVGLEDSRSVAKVTMSKPICADIGEKIAISRKMSFGASKSWRLVGWGDICQDSVWESGDQ